MNDKSFETLSFQKGIFMYVSKLLLPLWKASSPLPLLPTNAGFVDYTCVVLKWNFKERKQLHPLYIPCYLSERCHSHDQKMQFCACWGPAPEES